MKKAFKLWLLPLAFYGMAAVCSPVPSMAKDANPQPAASQAHELVKVDINKAGLEELESIKGIGPALAERIIAYRNENGKFKTREDLISVKGIGQAKFNRIKDQLLV